MGAILASLPTIRIKFPSFLEGLARSVDLLGRMGPTMDWKSDPFKSDRNVIRSDWEITRKDLAHGFVTVSR